MSGSAGLATARWARRLFRREWRQQIAVLTLLTLSLAAAVGSATATYNAVGVSEDAVFGSANHRYTLVETEPEGLRAAAAAGRERLGADPIFSWTRPIPGSVESLEFRAQNPGGPSSEPMLALVDGRYPGRSGEVAITNGVAETFDLSVGDTWGLDGTARRVVGTVENPSDLRSDFALVSPDDTAEAKTVSLLVGGRGGFDEVRELRAFGSENRHNADLTSRGDVEDATAAAAVLGVAAIVLLLITLVAAAGFVALAQRRLRQLGMFAAVGGTERQLRLVVVANGALIGIVSALAGVVLGLAAWIAVAPLTEESVGHRIDVWNVPWWIVAGAMGLVIVSSVAAAWWPARIVSQVPVVSALSGRPPRPRPARRSAGIAAAMIAVGVASLYASAGNQPALLALGAAAAAIGALLLSPLAIRALAAAGRLLPVAPRLALRDLSRQRARSGVALAAISLALGIPVTIVVAATAAENSGGIGNLSDRQLLVWTRDEGQPPGVSPYYTEDPDDEGFSPYLPDLDASEIDALGSKVGTIAAGLGDAPIVPLGLVVDPRYPRTPDGRLAVTLAQRTDIGHLDVALLFLAEPELLARYGADSVGAADVLTVPPEGLLSPQTRAVVKGEELFFLGSGDGPGPAVPVGSTETIENGYTSLPGSFVTPSMLRRQGWDTVTVGWLLEADTPLTPAQIRTARRIAAAAGMLVESRRVEPSLLALRWGATGIGLLVALGVLALTVGLIRAEASRDLRTLAAAGASRRIRRTLTAVTASALALLGGLIGVATAYVGLGATLAREVGNLEPVPALQLLTILFGIPAIAAAAGWLLAGREPRGLARQALE